MVFHSVPPRKVSLPLEFLIAHVFSSNFAKNLKSPNLGIFLLPGVHEYFSGEWILQPFEYPNCNTYSLLENCTLLLKSFIDIPFWKCQLYPFSFWINLSIILRRDVKIYPFHPWLVRWADKVVWDWEESTCPNVVIFIVDRNMWNTIRTKLVWNTFLSVKCWLSSSSYSPRIFVAVFSFKCFCFLFQLTDPGHSTVWWRTSSFGFNGHVGVRFPHREHGPSPLWDV